MYETSGIHSDLMEIKNSINQTHIEDTENVISLKKQIYKCENIINDLLSLNKKILSEIVSKNNSYALPISNVDAKWYTNKELPSDFLEVVHIPLNKIIVDKFNSELKIIERKYKEE